MQTFTTLAEQIFLKLIKEEIDRLKDQLAHNTYNRIEEFRYVMGQIAAYENMTNILDEAKEKADQSHR